ncbi:hypothetical protein BDV40DRAFT_267512 [Aspergillus tamarii]|uniref:Uncharacterized protein n=1 Tax=Aspergillus tamarii TaxID=41984 RepID=A0A5N6USF6_ASPTM|nr:hypothetical protein BDV40DRAFT_267512 [Aspergillus tamarii]
MQQLNPMTKHAAEGMVPCGYIRFFPAFNMRRLCLSSIVSLWQYVSIVPILLLAEWVKK